jgi:hypothetical protein
VTLTRLWTQEQRELLIWFFKFTCGPYDRWQTKYYPVRGGSRSFEQDVCQEFADYMNAHNPLRPVTPAAVRKQLIMTVCPRHQVPASMKKTRAANRKAARKVGFLPPRKGAVARS